MEKIRYDPSRFLDKVYSQLKSGGALLVSAKRDNSVNVMTIGWALIGRLWEEDFALIAVRPSRYTFSFIEESNDFTINIPKKGMDDILEYCGTVSGREEDKIKQKKLNLIGGSMVNSPLIEQCCLHYECKVYYKTPINDELLAVDIISMNYPQNDFHTLYFGKILNVLGDKYIDRKIL